MRFEWDEAKNTINKRKHGYSFEVAATIWRGPVVTEVDFRNYGEERLRTLGVVGNTVVLLVVHLEDDETIRIISARKADPGERKRYYEKIYRSKW